MNSFCLPSYSYSLYLGASPHLKYPEYLQDVRIV